MHLKFDRNILLHFIFALLLFNLKLLTLSRFRAADEIFRNYTNQTFNNVYEMSHTNKHLLTFCIYVAPLDNVRDSTFRIQICHVVTNTGCRTIHKRNLRTRLTFSLLTSLFVKLVKMIL